MKGCHGVCSRAHEGGRHERWWYVAVENKKAGIRSSRSPLNRPGSLINQLWLTWQIVPSADQRLVCHLKVGDRYVAAAPALTHQVPDSGRIIRPCTDHDHRISKEERNAVFIRNSRFRRGDHALIG
ncbi:MAG: hypothetical protein KatS3mg057_1591 [Herpetosiphonaceae bacterium]|nr:MAG: hypothetical protein KatS3mg057_1591 [Herpetosiphonaceae bacterium]